MFVFCTSCEGQNKPDPKKEKIKSETKDVSTSLESDEGTFHTKYEYADSAGKRLIIRYFSDNEAEEEAIFRTREFGK